MTRSLLGALAAVLAIPLAAFTHAPVAVGPPWISIEYPVNPYDATTRDAFLQVNAYHHGTPVTIPVGGTAEGLVDGKRQSITLDFGRTSRTGIYALRKQWPDQGTWSLVIWVEQGKDDRATALVELGADGRVARVDVPTRRQGGWVVPAGVAMRDVEAGLLARSRALVRR
jgi:hypothetical protein